MTNFPPSSCEFREEEARKLIRAVSACPGERLSRDGAVDCPAGCYLQFYRGTNLLAQVHGHDRHFILDGVSYTDRSGTLLAAWEVLYKSEKR